MYMTTPITAPTTAKPPTTPPTIAPTGVFEPPLLGGAVLVAGPVLLVEDAVVDVVADCEMGVGRGRLDAPDESVLYTGISVRPSVSPIHVVDIVSSPVVVSQPKPVADMPAMLYS